MNEEWTINTLKAHFDDLLTERINTIRAIDRSFSEAIEKLEERVNKLAQDYAKSDEVNILRNEISRIKSDHVQRREFNEIKDEHAQGRGIRLALVAASGIAIALITVALGAMYANQLTHADISRQIQIEAPWTADRPGIETEIHTLQQQVVLLKTQLAAHEATDKIRFLSRK